MANAVNKKGQVNTKKRQIFHSRCEYPFSAMLALEDNANSTRILTDGNKSITIPQGSFMIWRGDYGHAGAAYSPVNRRLFFHILHANYGNSII